MLRGVIVSSLKLSDIKGQIDFALLQSGFTDYGISKLKIKDSYFEENYKFAKENNINVGVFYESRATNLIEAKEEIDFFINIINDKKFEYPICLKIEDDHNTMLYYQKSQKEINKKTLCNIVSYMYNILESYDYFPCIITYKDWYDNIFSNLKLNFLIDKDFYNRDVNIEIVVKKNTIFAKICNYIKAGYKILKRKVRKK